MLVDEDGSEPVEVALPNIHGISATGTADGTPSITMSVSSPDGKRGTMVFSFIGGGGIPARDERARIRQAIGSAVAAVRAEASGAKIPEATETGTVSGQDLASRGTRILLSAEHILVKKKEYTAELTADLLILKTADLPDASPLTVSRDAIAGGSAESTPAGDPVLRLKVQPPGGPDRSMVLVFSEWHAGGRGPERDRWLSVLKGAAVPAAAAERSRTSPPQERGIPLAGKNRSAPEGFPSPRGAARPAPSSSTEGSSFCTECGGELPGEVKFCPHCGASQEVEYKGYTPGGTGKNHATKRRRSPPGSPPKRHKRAPKRKLSFRFKSQEGGISRVSVMEKVFGFLLAPEDAFSHTRSEDVWDGVVHLTLMMVLFAAVQGSAFFLIGGSVDAVEYPVMAGIAADTGSLLLTMAELGLTGIIVIVLEAMLVFFVLRLSGYADGPGETVRTCCYAATPFGTIGLLPVFGPLLAILWTLFLQFRGIRTVHETPAGIAAAAIVLPVIIAAALFWFLVIGGGGEAAAVAEEAP